MRTVDFTDFVEMLQGLIDWAPESGARFDWSFTPTELKALITILLRAQRNGDK